MVTPQAPQTCSADRDLDLAGRHRRAGVPGVIGPVPVPHADRSDGHAGPVPDGPRGQRPSGRFIVEGLPGMALAVTLEIR